MDAKILIKTEFKKEKFAELVRREQRDRSVMELSARTGVSPVALYRYIGGKKDVRPRIASIRKLAQASAAGITMEEYMDAAGYAYVEDRSRSEKKYTVFDHKGNAYASHRAMCRHYCIHPATYFRRIKMGWTVEQALTSEAHSRHNAVYDHEGTRYKSLTAMSKVYGLPKQKLSRRLKAGWPLKDALTRSSNTTSEISSLQ